MQFAWLDALLGTLGEGAQDRLTKLRETLLPAHVHYTWRYRSVGSSANNHLLGELAGLILAVSAWPALEHYAVSLGKLHRLWEGEVLAQFAPDGGNREQALNYHLFSWELCWQTREALEAAGIIISQNVHERLAAAREFFLMVQTELEPWDYGDSDNALVSPVAGREEQTTQEWRRWLANPSESPSIDFWWKHSRHRPQPGLAVPAEKYFPESGIWARRNDGWMVRWDLSPLGYGSTAAHGHLDALHISIWYQGVAMIIDPGTGAYYADRELRNHLASRQAHNGPSPAGIDYPRRAGPFLWQEHHRQPAFQRVDEQTVSGELTWDRCRLRRVLRALTPGGYEIEDRCDHPAGYTVLWQFAPESMVERMAEKLIRVTRRGKTIWLRGEASTPLEIMLAPARQAEQPHWGTVSPGFRAVAWAPYVQMRLGGGEKPCVLRTSFLASDPS